jgi:HEAT repeat protein
MGAAAVPALAGALEDPSTDLRNNAALVLSRIGAAARPAVPSLSRALERWEDPFYAALALARIQGGEAVPALVSLLRTGSEDRRWDALVVLGSLLGEAKAAIPDIMAALRDPSPRVRVEAAVAWRRVDPSAKAAAMVAVLVEALQSDSQHSALTALEEMGFGARGAVPALIDLVHGPPGDVRLHAACVLANVHPVAGRQALSLVVEALSSDSVIVRRSAVVGLEAIGPASDAVLPALRRAANDPEVGEMALRAIRWIEHGRVNELPIDTFALSGIFEAPDGPFAILMRGDGKTAVAAVGMSFFDATISSVDPIGSEITYQQEIADASLRITSRAVRKTLFSPAERVSVTPVLERYTGAGLSLNLKAVDVLDVLRFFSDLSHLSVVAGRGVTGRVTLRVRRVPWDQALATILAARKLAYRLDDTILRFGRPADLQPAPARSAKYSGNPISMDLKEGDLRSICTLLGHEVGGFDVVFEREVSGRTTVRLAELPWDQALEAILQSQGLRSTVEGKTIRIGPAASAR